MNWSDVRPVDVRALFRDAIVLRCEVDNDAPVFQDIKASGDQNRLDQWTADKQKRRANQDLFQTEFGMYKEHDQKFRAIHEQRWKDEMLHNRHAEIKKRLKVLGWTEQDMVFPRHTQTQWLTELNHNTPFTEKHWNKIKGRMIVLLEVNRATRPAWEKEYRQANRYARLRTLWNTTFRAELVSQTGPLPTSQTLAEAGLAVSCLLPIPEYLDIAEWPIIRELRDTDVSATEMEANFTQSRAQIYQAISIWGGSAKAALADVVRRELAQIDYTSDTPIVGTITGDSKSNPFSELSPDTQLFIRADTLIQGTYLPNFYSYDTFIRLVRQGQMGCAPLDTTKFKCHPTAPAITRALLKSLGRPTNTSILELQALDERFVCGRCHDTNPKPWFEVVQHYVTQGKQWEDVRTSWFIDHGITFHNLHTLEPGNPKPLIRIVGAEEQWAMAADDLEDLNQLWVMCGPCLHSWSYPQPFTRAKLVAHLCQAHELSQPQLEDSDVELSKISKKQIKGIDLYEVIIERFMCSTDGYDYEGSQRNDMVVGNMRNSIARKLMTAKMTERMKRSW
ncbi:hypothetical protein BDV93DRAFT_523976 [Ceratobasidium sp. AG-I]|nr:hypothetical protein BDV93DRAFT_523976 [Ceratobasidium sp. AG-I]